MSKKEMVYDLKVDRKELDEKNKKLKLSLVAVTNTAGWSNPELVFNERLSHETPKPFNTYDLIATKPLGPAAAVLTDVPLKAEIKLFAPLETAQVTIQSKTTTI